MAASKHFGRIVAWATAAALLIALGFMAAGALGVSGGVRRVGYENKLFDTSYVHTIDIAMDDWEGFLDGCTDEQYVLCSLTIDGETYPNTAIRAKGNTSMSSVAQLRSSRYSFKIEFDHYDETASYHGLDKLNLNNGIFDNTYMKDYLVYRMMNDFGAAAPLCSFAWICVNGEPWGLYLAIEGVEDGFLRRNYGNADGDLYKPDGLGWGGDEDASEEMTGGIFDMDTIGRAVENTLASILPTPTPLPADTNTAPSAEASGEASFEMPAPGGGGPGGFGMGDSDVKLRYIDDDPASYPNIFDGAKATVTDEDKARLIASLKDLTNYENLDAALDMDAVLRYFVVHNFVCNGDSYTGGLVHNYYLYEQDGHLSMIPWDYNFAFGTFQSGDAQGEVNDPIDTPGDTNGSGDRPMIDWIFSSEEYTALYHEYFAEFIDDWFATGKLDALLDETMALIAPYIAVDPTAFCSLEEFGVGVSTLREFCHLRAESIAGQLDGSIPSTESGQRAESLALIDASSIRLSDMGKMGGDAPSPSNSSAEMPQPPSSNEPAPPDSTTASGEASTAQTAASGETQASPASGETQESPASGETQESTASGEIQTTATSGETSGESSDRPGGEMPQPTSSEMAQAPSGEWPQESENETLWLLFASLLTLAAALIFARRFRRRRG